MQVSRSSHCPRAIAFELSWQANVSGCHKNLIGASFVSVVHRLRRPAMDETVPHRGTLWVGAALCSMSGSSILFCGDPFSLTYSLVSFLGTTSQLAEKLVQAVGRGFIPGIKPIKSTRASAPANSELPVVSSSTLPVPHKQLFFQVPT
jgi:hypothetical protein